MVRGRHRVTNGLGILCSTVLIAVVVLRPVSLLVTNTVQVLGITMQHDNIKRQKGAISSSVCFSGESRTPSLQPLSRPSLLFYWPETSHVSLLSQLPLRRSSGRRVHWESTSRTERKSHPDSESKVVKHS